MQLINRTKKNKEPYKIKKAFPFSIPKLLMGAALIIAAVYCGRIYFLNIRSAAWGFFMILFGGGGALLVYLGLNSSGGGYSFKDVRFKETGQENALVWMANKVNGKDKPKALRFLYVRNIPEGATLHFVRNLKKHFYELYVDTATRKLKPYELPDKKPFPPELYVKAAFMQEFLDFMEYNPASTLQKISMGVLIAFLVLTPIFMLMTSGG